MTFPMLARGVLVALLCLALPAAAAAQNRLAFDRQVTGTLSRTDKKLDDGSFYQEWTFTASAGNRVVITMRSTAFDAYLHLGRYTSTGGFDELDTDDDGGGGVDAQIPFTIPTTGEYVIRANSVTSDKTGAYSLLLTGGSAPAPAQASAPPASVLTRGVATSGTWDSSDSKFEEKFHEDWTFTGRAGEQVTITLDSPNVDTFLRLYRENGADDIKLGEDDDGGDGLNSRLVITLPADGTYLVCASTAATSDTGNYTVRVSAGAPSTAAPAPAPAPAPALGRRFINAGQTVSSQLDSADPRETDNTFYEQWIYQGLRGERLRIVMRSTAFDSWVKIGTVTGGTWSILEFNDDGAGGRDALLEITLPSDGEFAIRANTVSAGNTGAYTLLVQSQR